MVYLLPLVFLIFRVLAIPNNEITVQITLIQDSLALHGPTGDRYGSLMKILNKVSKFVTPATGIKMQVVATFKMDINYNGSNLTRFSEMVDRELLERNLQQNKFFFPMFLTGKVFTSDLIVSNPGILCQANTTIVISTRNLQQEPTTEIAVRMARGLLLKFGAMDQIQEQIPMCLSVGRDRYRNGFPICGNGGLEIGEFGSDSCDGVEDISIQQFRNASRSDKALDFTFLGFSYLDSVVLTFTVLFVWTVICVLFLPFKRSPGYASADTNDQDPENNRELLAISNVPVP